MTQSIQHTASNRRRRAVAKVIAATTAAMVVAIGGHGASNLIRTPSPAEQRFQHCAEVLARRAGLESSVDKGVIKLRADNMPVIKVDVLQRGGLALKPESLQAGIKNNVKNTDADAISAIAAHADKADDVVDSCNRNDGYVRPEERRKIDGLDLG